MDDRSDVRVEDPPFGQVAEALGLGMPFQIHVSPDGAQRRFVYLGASCERLTGVAAAEGLTDPARLYERIAPEHREAFLAAERAALASLSPFDVEVGLRRPDGEARWVRIASAPRRLADGSTLWDGLLTDITDRRVAEERRELMMGELAHRAKNGMLVMLAMVRQAAQSANSAGEMGEILAARIQAMAASQDLLTAAGGRAVRLGDLFDQLLPMFDVGRFDIDPLTRDVTMPGETAIGMALLLHELGTNAVKYGALSSRRGRVRIAHRVAERDGTRAIEWRESGGPQVFPTGRRGFGSRLLEAALRDRGGKVEPSFPPEGFRAVVEFRAAD